MDDELLRSFYHRLFHSSIARHSVDCHYRDGIIVFIHLFAVLNNRSLLWSSDKRHWPLWTRRLEFPSYSQLMRRLKTARVQRLLEELDRQYRDQLPHSHQKFFDGKALTVGGFSKDPDAKRGKVPAGWARGYKVHILTDFSGAIDAFEVAPLDRGEPTIACKLAKQLNLDRVIVRGDSNYDSNRLYQRVADAGGRLIAPRKKPFTSLGHHPQHRDRRRSIKDLEMCDHAREAHEQSRIRIEQILAHLTNLYLSPLPNFVRRLNRVKRWVQTKILLFHAYLNLSSSKAVAA